MGKGLMVLLVCVLPGIGQAQVVRVGSEFQVNTYTGGYQEYPAKCRDAAGNFVVAWASDGQDGSDDGVFGQRFALRLPAVPAPALGLVGLSVTGAALLLGGLAAVRRRRRHGAQTPGARAGD